MTVGFSSEIIEARGNDTFSSDDRKELSNPESYIQ